MAVGTVTLFDNALQDMCDGTIPIWTTGPWYACLYRSGSTLPSVAFNSRSQITHTEHETTSSEYVRQALGTLAIAGTAPTTVFDSAIINFGSSQTISAKYLIVMQGDTTPADTDRLVFFVNLDAVDNTTTEVSSNEATFSVDAHSSNGWFYIS